MAINSSPTSECALVSGTPPSSAASPLISQPQLNSNVSATVPQEVSEPSGVDELILSVRHTSGVASAL